MRISFVFYKHTQNSCVALQSALFLASQKSHYSINKWSELVFLISFFSGFVFAFLLLFIIFPFFCLTLSEAPLINAFPAGHAHILNSSENCFSLAPILFVINYTVSKDLTQFPVFELLLVFSLSFFGQLNYNEAKTMKGSSRKGDSPKKMPRVRVT